PTAPEYELGVPANGLFRMPVFYSLLFLVMGFLTAASDSGGDLTSPAIALLFVLPPLVGSGLPLFRSSSPGIPLAVLKWTLLVALPAVPLLAAANFSRPLAESLLIGLAAEPRRSITLTFSTYNCD